MTTGAPTNTRAFDQEIRLGVDKPALARSLSGVFMFIVVVFIAARLWRLTTYSLRPDEIFSLQAARQSWSGLLTAVVKDVIHPPVFYLLLKVWINIGGQSELWLRLLPVLTAIAAIWPFALLCRELKLRKSEMNVALTLMAVNGYLIYYAQELRMYSLLLLLTLCSLWCFVRFANAADNATKCLMVLTALNLLLVYTQYYGWLVVGVEFLVLLLWRRSKLPSFSLSSAVLVLGFSPWALAVARVAAGRGGLSGNIGSFHRPQLADDLVGYYAMLAGPLHPVWKTLLALVLFNIPILLLAWRSHRGSRAEDQGPASTFWWLALFSFGPAVFSYCVSQVLPQSVWGTRFLIVVAAPYLILVALAVGRLPRHWTRIAMMLLVVGWAMLAGFQELRHPGKNAWAPLVRRMIQAEPSRSDGLMVYTIGSSDETIQFYLEEARETRFRTKRVKSTSDMDGDHFWVALLESRPRSPQRELTNRGYQVGEGFRDGFDAVLFPVWRR